MLDKKMALKMSEMGVSADVILKLMLEDDDTPDEGKAASPEDGKAASPEEGKAASPEEGKKESGAAGDPVLKAIERLTGMIAADNIRRDYKDSKTETSDDILAKVLINKGDEI